MRRRSYMAPWRRGYSMIRVTVHASRNLGPSTCCWDVAVLRCWDPSLLPHSPSGVPGSPGYRSGRFVSCARTSPTPPPAPSILLCTCILLTKVGMCTPLPPSLCTPPPPPPPSTRSTLLRGGTHRRNIVASTRERGPASCPPAITMTTGRATTFWPQAAIR
jgi:hypothetical protein